MKVLKKIKILIVIFVILLEPITVYGAGRQQSMTFMAFKDKYQLVDIPTYDGSNQLTHPKVLYFDKGWNGYKYWMAMTPYPNGNDTYENPSIVVSNDGDRWTVPEGLINPVSGIPTGSKKGEHYSDPHLVMHGNTMELWYRYNPALHEKGKTGRADNKTNICYRKTSEDGIHWSDAEIVLQRADGLLSPCIDYEDGIYKIWYTSYKGKLYYSQSEDAHIWDTNVLCSASLPSGFQLYHQDIIKNGNRYYLLQSAFKKVNYTFDLFLYTSDDGINFYGMQQVCPDHNAALWKGVSLYRSTGYIKDNIMHLYISIILPHNEFYITKSSLFLQ